MAGGYISCGDFSGDDKSGSAISGVFETLPQTLPEDERDSFIQQALNPLAEYLEDSGDHILNDSGTAAKLLPPVDRLYAHSAESEINAYCRRPATADGYPTDISRSRRYPCTSTLMTAD